jgi:aspartyl-tRNA(Asn)/glutamyl-tRNA(Gln) amidotransferase subunit A
MTELKNTLATRTLTDAAAALRDGSLTSTELVTEAISVADTYDGRVGMYIKRFDEQALEAAAAIDSDLAAGKELGPLAGIPLGIKDIITTRESETTGQSLVHNRETLSGDAVVVERLRSAGSVIMGKLSTMEFAIGAPDPEKPFPVPTNSWSIEHWAGGSSSGAGSSVSLGAVCGALGTDTGGSIRIPAAFCGISGLMPTYGRVPKSGCIPLGFTLDHIGPMARSAADCALMFDAMAGPHASDPTTLGVPVDSYSGALTGDLSGVRIGVDSLVRVAGEVADPAAESVFAAAVDVLEARGAEIVPIELPHFKEVMFANTFTMLSEALAYHLPDLQSMWESYGAPTRRIISSAVMFEAADYVQFQRVRRTVLKLVQELFGRVDLIVTPTAAAGAPTLEATFQRRLKRGPNAIFTGYWNAMGNPALSVPMGFASTGLPLGLQIVGRPFEEALCLKAGDAFQGATDWHLRSPDPLA